MLFSCSVFGKAPTGSFASFSAEVVNQTSTAAGGWIGPATNLGASPSGYDAQLGWTPGTHGPVTGEQLYGLDNGASASCPATGYSLLATMPSADTTSYTQQYVSSTTSLSGNITAGQTTIPVASASGFPASGNYTIQIGNEQMLVTGGQGTTSWTVQRGTNGTTAASHTSGAMVFQLPDPYGGHYYCFELFSTSASSWTAAAKFPALQLGLVATNVSITNGLNPGVIDSGDTVAVTYNQPTTLTAGTSAVCLFSDTSGNATVYVGDTTCANASTDPYDAVLTGSTASQTNTHKKMAANRTVSSSAPWTVTYTVTQNNNIALSNATWTLTPSMTVLSQNGGSDQAHACTDPTYNCTPTTAQSATSGF